MQVRGHPVLQGPHDSTHKCWKGFAVANAIREAKAPSYQADILPVQA
jgi:hypothetical protein